MHNDQQILTTIYITNYNYGQYISQAIESVLSQSFTAYELFIIDDGSTDNSKEIIESYSGHPKINVVYQKNKGLNITNNIALRLSSGKYIMRLDADDYLRADALQIMVDQLEQDDELGMVFPNYYLVDGSNHELAEIQRHDFDKDVRLLDQPAHGACTLIRTQFLKSVGGYDESFSCQDGYELWIKFISNYKVKNVSQPLFYYRQHGNNLTTNENRILSTRRKINKKFIDRNKISRPVTLAILPIRDTKMKGKSLAYQEVAGKKLIDLKIEVAKKANSVSAVVVTSADQHILDYVASHYQSSENVFAVERPDELARFNESLSGTVQHILAQSVVQAFHPKAIMILPIEFPFIDSEIIEDAVNTLQVFKSDSLISVRPDNATFYQHHGQGMTPILQQDKFTKFEREALYRGIGGIFLTKLSSFLQHGKILSGTVGHIVVDQQAAMGIHSEFDLLIAQALSEGMILSGLPKSISEK